MHVVVFIVVLFLVRVNDYIVFLPYVITKKTLITINDIWEDTDKAAQYIQKILSNTQDLYQVKIRLDEMHSQDYTLYPIQYSIDQMLTQDHNEPLKCEEGSETFEVSIISIK